MVTEDYVSFEVAKLLKEKWFDEPCFRYWQYDKANNKEDTDGISLSECNVFLPLTNSKLDILFGDMLMSFGYAAPTLQMTMKWLREVHGLFIFISTWTMLEDSIQYYFEIREIKTRDFETLYDYTSKELNSFEKVAEAAIKYCLENLI